MLPFDIAPLLLLPPDGSVTMEDSRVELMVEVESGRVVERMPVCGHVFANLPTRSFRDEGVIIPKWLLVQSLSALRSHFCLQSFPG